jgi:SAM-dependent methyltransferase
MLMFKVAGTPNAKWFWQGGLLAKKSLIDILEQNGLDIKSFESILDFGCGCGRVIRHLDFLDKTNLFGTDYNIDLIRWCTLNLGFAFFTTNQLQPPLNYQDCKFDFVYAFSVFTHLPEELQVAWRDEIWRCLKPEGFFLMTTHGEHFLSELTTSQLKQFQAGDLVVKWSVAAGKNYCGAFHPFSYVKKKFGECFTIIDFKPKGAEGNPYQDVYLLKKN